MIENTHSCKDCNGYWDGTNCHLHDYFRLHRLFGCQDCWHPEGTALPLHELEERQEGTQEALQEALP